MVDRRTKKQQGRKQYSVPSICAGLKIPDDDAYRRLYSIIEGEVIRRGIARSNFRSITERDELQSTLLRDIATSEDVRTQFPHTIHAIAGNAGRVALSCLIYKICTNYRRRRQNRSGVVQPCVQSDVPMQLESLVPVRDLPPSDIRPRPDEQCQPGAASGPYIPYTSPSLSERLVQIVNQHGHLEPICRLGELDQRWPFRDGHTSPEIDSLLLERFVGILEEEHGFKRGRHRLACALDQNTSGDAVSFLNTERQWRAVVSHLLQTSNSPALSFVVLNAK